MSVIFLDIDGVLNSTRSYMATENSSIDMDKEFPNCDISFVTNLLISTVDPIAVGLLNRLLEKSGADLWLISSHRNALCPRGQLYGSIDHLANLNKLLGFMGVEKTLTGITPTLHGIRGKEVEIIVNKFEIEDYVIFDDSADFIPGQPLVKIDPDIGLNTTDYYQACKILGVSEFALATRR